VAPPPFSVAPPPFSVAPPAPSLFDPPVDPMGWFVSFPMSALSPSPQAVTVNASTTGPKE
jgi:hypothetical protein